MMRAGACEIKTSSPLSGGAVELPRTSMSLSDGDRSGHDDELVTPDVRAPNSPWLRASKSVVMNLSNDPACRFTQYVGCQKPQCVSARALQAVADQAIVNLVEIQLRKLCFS
jgi:hypothetical protein